MFSSKEKKQCTVSYHSFHYLSLYFMIWEISDSNCFSKKQSWFSPGRYFIIWEFLLDKDKSSSDRYSCKKVTGHLVFSSCLHIGFLVFCLRNLVVFDGFSVCVKRSMLQTIPVLAVCFYSSLCKILLNITKLFARFVFGARDCVIFIKSTCITCSNNHISSKQGWVFSHLSLVTVLSKHFT